jgi:metal transporter CNNM
VLIFGEIIPSAIFSGPNQLRIAAFMSGFVWFLMLLLSPIAWPIAWT